MPGVMWVLWYATVLRQEMFAEEVSRVAPLALRYGATQYAVHRRDDDRYNIIQLTWCNSHDDWYRYWEGPEMIEFRAQHAGHYQVPITYYWYEELAAGAIGPEVPAEAEPEPQPSAEPQVTG
jgi:hypothetical protein